MSLGGCGGDMGCLGLRFEARKKLFVREVQGWPSQSDRSVKGALLNIAQIDVADGETG